MNPEGQTIFQPNRLVLEAAHRAAVACFGSLAGFRLSLRPARRYLFHDPPDVRSLQVELKKPAFAALLREDDVEARAALVLETETVSPGIRSLYRSAGIPVLSVRCRPGACQMVLERDGFYADLRPSDAMVDLAAQLVMQCSPATPACGCLVRTQVERTILLGLRAVCNELDCLVHHRVPFGYVVGYRPDLPGHAARQAIELVVGLHFGRSPAGEVVLPIRVETRPAKERDQECRDLDAEVAAFVLRAGIPMVAVEPADGGGYAVTCSMDGIEERVISEEDAQGWARYFDVATRMALEKVCSSMRGA
jgi:hypothetical protein